LGAPLPTVTIVFLVYNRREELRESLDEMLSKSDYPAELQDVIVVDNASEDGAAEMVEADFPQVRLIRRSVNCGVSGWNDGFALARGDYVLALDDDCYLPPDGLRRAVEAAREERADLVSFGVRSSVKPDHRFDHRYRTGLLTFWGCAALVRREALDELGGYDPEIFVWANELEFTLRLYDRGFRHLHLPEVVAVHMKEVNKDWRGYVRRRSYRVNARHFAYIAAKLFTPRDAVGALVALLAQSVRDGLRQDREGLKAVSDVVKGFAHGLRHRAPLRKREISRVYRHNFFSYASPWWLSRPPGEILRSKPSPPGGRRELYFTERARYYPDTSATLQF
jgi:GT2 family glycosyltransferase